MLEQRDDVGESLVEGQHVGVHGLVEAGVHAVKQCMRRFVSDDIVRQTTEYRPVFPRKISEQQRLVPPRIKCIGFGKCVRGNLELVRLKLPAHAATKGVKITSIDACVHTSVEPRLAG